MTQSNEHGSGTAQPVRYRIASPAKVQRRMLIIAQEREGGSALQSLLACGDLCMVPSEPLSLTLGFLADPSMNVKCVFDSRSHETAKYVCIRVTPEQLFKHRLSLAHLCEVAVVDTLVIVNRSSVIDSLVSKKLDSEGHLVLSDRKKMNVKDDEVESFLQQTLVEWDYVAQTMPADAHVYGKGLQGLHQMIAEHSPHHVKRWDGKETQVLFVEYEDIEGGACPIVNDIWKVLGCATGADDEGGAQHPQSPLSTLPIEEKIENIAEVSHEHKNLAISVRNILQYRKEEAKPDARSTENRSDFSPPDSLGMDTTDDSVPHSRSSSGGEPAGDRPTSLSTLKRVATSDKKSLMCLSHRVHPPAENALSAGEESPHKVIRVPEKDDAADSTSSALNGRWRMLGMIAMNVFLFHCLEAFLKEKIFHVEGFVYVEALTVMQSLIVGSVALMDCGRVNAPSTTRRDFTKGNKSQRSCIAQLLANRSECPFWVYALLGGLIATSQYMTNKSILHLNYVTQVVFKSSKLLWVMAARVMLLKGKKKPSATEWFGGVLIVVGLTSMSLDGKSGGKHGAKAIANVTASIAPVALGAVPEADWFAQWGERSKGLACIALALVCDASIFVVEEALAFGKYHASKQEVILFMQVLAIFPSTCFFILGGRMGASIDFVVHNPMFLALVLLCYVCSYLGTKSILHLVEAFDGTVAALVTSMRKIATIVFSFILFPKPLSLHFLFGAVMILAGANASIVRRWRKD
eukprot:Rhum_TRINITY_DN14364_c9_g1::Rhum_TRINITY_DN14364_c9_g1_i1::g.85501::m.85501/K15277/SLC35B3, PAPST2; solute carrier family 35 (adenosine 3'-phospho 5'-phosphosulfate transporter), member B3